MERIWEFFESLDEYMYVADMDTYELVYINQKLKEALGLHAEEEWKYKSCYDMLLHSKYPCTICQEEGLEEGKFKKRHYYDPVQRRYMFLLSTMARDGEKRYRMEIAVDLSEEKIEQYAFDWYQGLETMVNQAVGRAIQQRSPDRTISSLLEYLGLGFHGEWVYIFEEKKDGALRNTYEWIRPGSSPRKQEFEELLPIAKEAWYEIFKRNKSFIAANRKMIKESNPKVYECLEKLAISTVAIIPLFGEGRIVGFWGLNNFPEELLGHAIGLLSIMRHFLSASLKNRDLVNELNLLSYYDQQTKLGNRHAMVKYIRETKEYRSMGVVFSDITMLKHVNDTYGHEAGDRMIVQASDSLKEVFGKYELFRFGGDELLAICRDIEKEELEKKVGELKAAAKEKGVVLAVGAAWALRDGAHIEKLISEAEVKMYQDKSAYYKKMGIDRRR